MQYFLWVLWFFALSGISMRSFFLFFLGLLGFKLVSSSILHFFGFLHIRYTRF
jgi:hypothetical protein